MTLKLLKQIWKGEEGQDLVEYTLLLAFITLVAAGIFVQVGNSVSNIWIKANSHMAAAASAAQ